MMRDIAMFFVWLDVAVLAAMPLWWLACVAVATFRDAWWAKGTVRRCSRDV